jgi:opacity protein-like surface antigen
MRKVTMALALVLATGIAAQAAQAQQTEKAWQFGPQVNIATQHIGLGVGGRAVFTGLGSAVKVPGLGAFGSFDWFFPGNSYGVSPSVWEINVNATYDLKIAGLTGVAPYVGGGVNYLHWSTGAGTVLGFPVPSASGSETGLNLLGGGRFNLTPKLHAFAEARIEVRSGGAFVVTGGLLF